MASADLTGADAAMTLATIERTELRPALDLIRAYSESRNVEVRAFAEAWVAIGEALADGRDVEPAMQAFDEVVRLLGRPDAERLALLDAREIIEKGQSEA